MLISPLVLAAAFLVFGSSGVLAEISPTSQNGSLRAVTFPDSSAKKLDGKIQQETIEILQSKLQELEAQMKQLLPNSSLEGQGVGSENIPYDSSVVEAMQDWSSTDHLREAHTSQQEATTLEKSLQKLQSRIDRFAQKPYLDTKGFKRSGFKILKGNLTQELREAR